jgi:hypothetical protein
MMKDSDPVLSSEEVESFRWIAFLRKRQNVPLAHFETLLEAGYITDSLIDPDYSEPAERALLDEKRRVGRSRLPLLCLQLLLTGRAGLSWCSEWIRMATMDCWNGPSFFCWPALRSCSLWPLVDGGE